VCDNGIGYIFDFGGRTVSMYDPSNPDAGPTQGSVPLSSSHGGLAWDWVDPINGGTCELRSAALGVVQLTSFHASGFAAWICRLLTCSIRLFNFEQFPTQSETTEDGATAAS
jgi:hypothetical protein